MYIEIYDYNHNDSNNDNHNNGDNYAELYIYIIYIYIFMQCTFKHTLEMGFYNGTFYEILMGFKQQNGDLTGLSHFSHLYLGYKGTIMEF